ncbi:unnamed protein product [Caenorhabditis bovis]|uniref:glucuronosyltransferase n=1 Tax=Caenorhabditis bovis TaxID=2654633 RepID=A0A8S1F317_9PELO|nr:unnamed protein product [Caenorhabditis bovis]
MRLFALLFSIFLNLDAYKILVYTSLFGHSHVKMLGSVADILTDAGHNVTVLMPIIDVNERNRTGLKSTKNLIMVEPCENGIDAFENLKRDMSLMWNAEQGNPLSLVSKLQQMSEVFMHPCDNVIGQKDLIERMKAEKFDLGVAEPFDFCGYAFFEAIQIRAHVSVVAAARMDHVSEAMGQPMAASYVPGAQSVYSDRMNMKERFLNLLLTKAGGLMFSYIADSEFDLLQKKYPDVIKRSWREIFPETTYLFTNSIPIMDYPAPTFDKIIPIGGISVVTDKKKNALPEKWDKVLNIRKKNVLISFGSNAKSIDMPEEYRRSLLKMFAMTPDVTFIWKYEEENSKIVDHLDNVFLGTWLPQNELLADKRLTVFLTHGGLASTFEMALLGKPCIMVPIFADQARNAQMLQRQGSALVLNKENLGDPNKIKEALEKIMNDDTFVKNATRLAEMLNNRPTNPRETFVKHVEFAARFGRMPSMEPYARHQSFIEHFFLDIIAIGLLIVITILVYSNLLAHSHVKMLGSVADILTDAGHNVTVLMPIIDVNERNRTGLKSTMNVVYVEPTEAILEMLNELRNDKGFLWKNEQGNPLSLLSRLHAMSEAFKHPCDNVIGQKDLIERMKAEKFDLGVAEPFDFCGYAFFEAIQIRAHVSVVAAARMDHVSEAMGQPMAASYVPGTQSVYSDRMNMKERFLNLLLTKAGGIMFSYVADSEFDLLQKKYPDVIKRSWRDILPETTYLFTNNIPILDFPAPTFDKIIPIGGISVVTDRKKNTLPEKWDKVLNIRKKNVLISFGSNAKSIDMPEEYRRSLLKMFAMMPDVTFIWKYEEENSKIVDHLDNVFLGTWLPQNELLADKRLTVFLTHGGLASTFELALLGKPCIMVPIFADQARNAQMLQRQGSALVLNKENLGDPNKIKEALEKIMNDDTFVKNATRLAEMLNNRPTNPRETFVKHVEFAARFGRMPSMEPYARHQSFIEHFFLDIIAIGLLVVITVATVSFWILRCLLRRIFGGAKVKSE